MNLMFIIPSLSGGGAERVTLTLASALSKKHKVYIVVYYYTENSYKYDSSLIIKNLGINDAKSISEKVKHTLTRIRLLKKIKKELKIECSISMLHSPNFENVMSYVGERQIISVRNKCSEQVTGFNKWINSFTSKKADMVVAISKNVMKDQIMNFKTPKNNICTIYNPCDIYTIKKCSEETLEDEFKIIRENSSILFITVGRLDEQKGQWHLIRAFKKVVEYDPNSKLIVLGKGKLEDFLKHIIVTNKLENNVFLFGFHSNPYKYMANSDVFVFSSLFEGFGNVLLEAMACGLPIISSDCDAGPRELLEPTSNPDIHCKEIEYASFGILVPVCSGEKNLPTNLEPGEEYMARAMIKLASDIKLRHKYQLLSKKRIRDFSLEKIVEEWEAIINGE